MSFEPSLVDKFEEAFDRRVALKIPPRSKEHKAKLLERKGRSLVTLNEDLRLVLARLAFIDEQLNKEDGEQSNPSQSRAATATGA